MVIKPTKKKEFWTTPSSQQEKIRGRDKKLLKVLFISLFFLVIAWARDENS